MGTPADARTRAARHALHLQFDQLWKSGALSRGEAYLWLQRALGLEPDEAHIGHFSLKQCERVHELLADEFPALRRGRQE